VRRPSVYLAHPVVSYGSDHERACLYALAELLPDARILNPAELYASGTEWLAHWPGLVPRLTGVVAFGDEGGVVGTGVMRELADAIAYGVPLAALDVEASELREIAGFDFLPPGLRDAGHAARLRLGEPVERRWLDAVEVA
jgi:hypothetical protein